MADQDAALVRAQRLDHAGDIADHVFHVIGLDGVRLVRAAIAAHIDGAGGEAGLGDRPDLVAPGIPALRKAVHHHHQRAGALDHGPQSHIGQLDETLFHLSAP